MTFGAGNHLFAARVQAGDMRSSAKRLAATAAIFLAAHSFRPSSAHAQQSDPKAVHWVEQAVEDQLNADARDIAWMYRDHSVRPDRDIVSQVVDTPHGGIRRTLVSGGKPLTGAAWQAETDRINKFVQDADAQTKQRKNAQHDEEQANELLRMWPTAFLWSVKSETSEFLTLHYRPNPDFNPPSTEARVMSQMEGDMVLTHNGTHIYSIHSRLMQDIHIAFGLVRLKAGGTVQIERREIAPGRWQIVEQHVHIQGHALLFKSISEQEDDWKSDFKPSPAQTFEDAARILNEQH